MLSPAVSMSVTDDSDGGSGDAGTLATIEDGWMRTVTTWTMMASAVVAVMAGVGAYKDSMTQGGAT